MKNFLFVLAVAVPMFAQQNPPCSLTSAGTDVQIFACSGLKAQGLDIVRILNLIAGNKLDTQAVMAKLAELPRGADALSASLSDAQKANLLALAKMYPGTKITVVSAKNDPAAAHMASEIASVLSGGGWIKPDGSRLVAEEYSGAAHLGGIQVAMNDHDHEGDAEHAPKAAVPLMLSLQYMGLPGNGFGTAEVPSGQIQIRIGSSR